MPTHPCHHLGCPNPTRSTHCPPHTQPRPYNQPNYRRASAAMRGMPCVVCGAPSDTLDHIVPVAQGGTNHASNLQPMCRPCNASKGAA